MLGFNVKDKSDPKKIDKDKVVKLLERLGVASKPLQAESVEIRTPEKIIRIKDPDVIISLLFGRDVYQIAGEVEEISLRPGGKELKKMMKEAGKEKAEVPSKLAELNYDVAKSVAEMKELQASGKQPKKGKGTRKS